MKLIQEKIVIGCGLVLLVLPFTGFPRNWKIDISCALGVVIIYVGALLYRKTSAQLGSKNSETKTNTFTETI